MSAAKDQPRMQRLLRELAAGPEPIVWIRGVAGSGKSRLIEAYRAAHPGPDRPTMIDLDTIDDEALLPLKEALRQIPAVKLVVASRASSAVEQMLLRSAAYGRVRVLGDADLFYRYEELPHDDVGGDRLHEATAGWPLLVDAATDGRSETLKPLLPDFLDQEALPSMSHGLVVALFAAIDSPLSTAAAAELVGANEHLPPLLKRDGEAIVIGSSWCRGALETLRTRTNLWRRATADAAVRLHVRHGNHAQAILALNGLGQTVQACDVYEAAGGAVFAARMVSARLRPLLDSFPAGLDHQRDSLLLGRVWQSLLEGRPAAALARLESRYPGLPIDLRRLRYSHRPIAILFRLLVEADMIGDLSADVIESWELLDQLLEPDDRGARTLLAIAMAQALSLTGAADLANRQLRDWRRSGASGQDDECARRAALVLAHLAYRLGRLTEARAYLTDVAEEDDIRRGLTSLVDADQAEKSADAPCAEEILAQGCWPALSLDLLRNACVETLHRDGLPIALDRLGNFASLVRRRHCGIDEQYVDLLRIRLHQMAGRHGDAAVLLAEAGSVRNSVETEFCRLRSRLASRRPDIPAIETSLRAIETAVVGSRDGTTFLLLQAACCWRDGRKSDARRHMMAALRDAQDGQAISWFREEAQLIETVLLDLIEHRHGVPETLLPFAEAIARDLRKPRGHGHSAPEASGLSRQEYRVLDHLAGGLPNKAIARALEISESTVKFHLQGLFAKLGVNNRTALVDEARRRKVIR